MEGTGEKNKNEFILLKCSACSVSSLIGSPFVIFYKKKRKIGYSYE